MYQLEVSVNVFPAILLKNFVLILDFAAVTLLNTNVLVHFSTIFVFKWLREIRMCNI
jgi:hypothetical protein